MVFINGLDYSSLSNVGLIEISNVEIPKPRGEPESNTLYIILYNIILYINVCYI